MKNICIVPLVCLCSAGVAQNIKKDSVISQSMQDYGARIFEPRLGQYISMDTIKDNPYVFMDWDKPKKKTKRIKQK